MNVYTTDSNKVSSKRKFFIINLIKKIHGKNIPKNHIPFYKNKRKVRITCKICKNDNTRFRRSKTFYDLESITKHTLRFHDVNDTTIPTVIDVFKVYEKISICLEKKISISTIPEVTKWGIEVN